MEFSKETEALMRIQAEMKMELENPIAQPENQKKALQTEWINQRVEYQELKTKVEGLDQTRKDYEKKLNIGMEHNVRYHGGKKLQTVGIDERKESWVIHPHRYEKHREHQLDKTKKWPPMANHS